MIIQIINEIASNPTEAEKNNLRQTQQYLTELLKKSTVITPDTTVENSKSDSLIEQEQITTYNLSEKAILEAKNYALNPAAYLEILKIMNNTELSDSDIDHIITIYKKNITSENDLKAAQNVVALSYRVHKITPEYLWLIYINPITVSYKNTSDGIIESRTTFVHEILKAQRSKEFIFSFFELLHKALSLNHRLITSYLLLSDKNNKSIIECLYETQFHQLYLCLYDEIKNSFPSLFYYTEQELQGKFLSSKYGYFDKDTIITGIDKTATQAIVFFIEQNKLDNPKNLFQHNIIISRNDKWEQTINNQLSEFSKLANDLSNMLSKEFKSTAGENITQLKAVANFIENINKGNNFGIGNELSPTNILTFGVSLKEITAICYFTMKQEGHWCKQVSLNNRFMNFVSDIYKSLHYKYTMNATEYVVAQYMLESIKNSNLSSIKYIHHNSKTFLDTRLKIISMTRSIFSAYISQLKNHQTREIMTILWEWREYNILPKRENFIISFCKFFYNHHNINTTDFSFIETIKFIHIIFNNLTPPIISDILHNINFSHFFANSNSLISHENFVIDINVRYSSRYKLKLEHMHANKCDPDDALLKLSTELQHNFCINTIQRNLQFFNALMHIPYNNSNYYRSLSQLATWVLIFKIHLNPNQDIEFLNIKILVNISLQMNLSEAYKCILVSTISPLTEKEIKQIRLINTHYQNTLNVINMQYNLESLDINLVQNHHKAILDKIYQIGNLINTTNEEILISAVQNNYLELVIYLMHKQVSVTYQDKKGKTALHYAATIGNSDIAEIIANQDNILIQDQAGKTALHYACIKNHPEIVALLLNSSLVIIQDFDGRTALHYACMNKTLDNIYYLLNYNNIINIQDNFNNTALHYALSNKNEHATRLILSTRPNLHIKNDKEHNAIIYAILCQFPLSIIKEMAAQDVSILFHLTNTGNNIIYYACKYYSSHELFVFLYTSKLNMSHKNSLDITPLLYSLISLHYNSAKLLLKLGSTPWEYQYYNNQSIFPHLPTKVKNTIKQSILTAKNIISNFKSHHASRKKLCSWKETSNESQDRMIRNIIGSFDINDALMIAIIDINFDLFTKIIKNISMRKNTSNAVLDDALFIISYQLTKYKNYDAKYHPEIIILVEMINYIISKHNDLPNNAVIKLNGLVEILSSQALDGEQQQKILHYIQNSALSINCCKIIKPLLDEFNIPQNMFGSIIYIHIIKRDHSALQDLLTNNSKQTLTNTAYGTTPLMLAIMLNDLKSIEIILAHPQKINAQNSYGNSALHFAVKSQFSKEILELLLNKEVDINIKNTNNQTPILFSQDTQTALTLMNHSANPWHIDKLENSLFDILYPASMRIMASKNIFHAAIYFIKSNIIEHFMLAAKYISDINIVNEHNESLLHFAVQYQNIIIIEYLLSYNIDTSLRNSNNCTAFQLLDTESNFYSAVMALKKQFNIEDSLTSSPDISSTSEQVKPSSFTHKLRETVQQREDLLLSDNSSYDDQFSYAIYQSRQGEQMVETLQETQSNTARRLRERTQQAQSIEASNSLRSASQFRSMVEQARQSEQETQSNIASRLRSQVQHARSDQLSIDSETESQFQSQVQQNREHRNAVYEL